MSALLAVFAGLRARLAKRPDTEHEQALVRVGNCLLFGAYLFRELQQGGLGALEAVAFDELGANGQCDVA